MIAYLKPAYCAWAYISHATNRKFLVSYEHTHVTNMFLHKVSSHHTVQDELIKQYEEISHMKYIYPNSDLVWEDYTTEGVLINLLCSSVLLVLLYLLYILYTYRLNLVRDTAPLFPCSPSSNDPTLTS